MDSIETRVAMVLEEERKEAERAATTEKKQVNINSNCYIAKEIKYQTVLLRELRNEMLSMKQELLSMKKEMRSR